MAAKFRAIDIANFFVQLCNDLPEAEITNLKLNKICYYAQAWSLVKLGRPLFSDAIQAWEKGPVIPEVYHAYKVCGKNPIAEPLDSFDESLLDSDELGLLVDVYSTYGKYTPGELVEMTHIPGGPWEQVFEERQNHEIRHESMMAYYSLHDELEEFRPYVTKENTIDYSEAAYARV